MVLTSREALLTAAGVALTLWAFNRLLSRPAPVPDYTVGVELLPESYFAGRSQAGYSSDVLERFFTGGM